MGCTLGKCNLQSNIFLVFFFPLLFSCSVLCYVQHCKKKKVDYIANNNSFLASSQSCITRNDWNMLIILTIKRVEAVSHNKGFLWFFYVKHSLHRSVYVCIICTVDIKFKSTIYLIGLVTNSSFTYNDITSFEQISIRFCIFDCMIKHSDIFSLN